MERRPKARWERLLAGLVLVILSPIWVPLAVLVLILRFALGLLLYIAIWILWFPRGKDTLFVYSNSPIWENYMLEQVLPPVRERAIVINWSDRKRWKNWSLAVRAFHYFGGRRAFNPRRDFSAPQVSEEISVLVGIQGMETWKSGAG